MPAKKLRHDDAAREEFEAGFEKGGVDVEGEKRERSIDPVVRFVRAIEEHDLYEAYVELRGLRFSSRKYTDLKEDFVDLVDHFLNQEGADLVEKYRSDLMLLRESVRQNKLDYLIISEGMLKGLSEFGRLKFQQQLEEKVEKVEREIVITRFRALMEQENVDAYDIFFQLVKAREKAMPEFEEMKIKFLEWLDKEILADSRDLEKATKVHLVKLRQRLREQE